VASPSQNWLKQPGLPSPRTGGSNAAATGTHRLTQVLFARLNPRSVAVKGGANLRYFFDSHRYSDDIAVDVVSGEEWKLFDQVDRAIASPALSLLLRATGVSVEQSSPHKQSGTTQRWKLSLKRRL